MAKPAVAWFEVTGTDGPALQRFSGDLFDVGLSRGATA